MWQGEDVKPTNGTSFIVSGPAIQIIRDRIFDLKLKVTDYLTLPISGADVTLTLVNGTVSHMVSGGNGSVDFGLVPIGTFTGSVSYLGVSTSVSGDASIANTTTATVFASYPMLLLLVVALAIAVAGGFFYRRRSSEDVDQVAEGRAALPGELCALRLSQ